jgi:hypothetical protein
MPSPTTGRRPEMSSPTLNGHLPAAIQSPVFGLPSASPVGRIAWSRVLAGIRSAASRIGPAAWRLAAFGPPVLRGPSLPTFTWYCSFVPSTISGRASPEMFATAGVSMISPWSGLSSPPFSSGAVCGFQRIWCDCGSTEPILLGSFTSTGKPLTGKPPSFQA